jgi:hypothetical protein
MNRLLVLLTTLLVATAGYAQTDTSSKNAPDTMRVGNFIIVKKNKEKAEGTKEDTHFKISVQRRHRNYNSNVFTNWFVFDLGFANWRDKTNYTSPQFTNQGDPGNYTRNIPNKSAADNPVNKNSFNLRTGKSSNVNIWLFMQKRNLIKHVVNLKYGLGLEMYNYRFESNISFRNTPQPYIFMDSLAFTKNKLYAGYVTVPFMLNITPSGKPRRGFTFSAGMSAGYLIGSRNKQISAERGKQKIRGNLNMEPWRLATVGEIGLGPVRLYGSYSLNSLQQKDRTGLEQYPYTVGIRFSTF